MSEPFAEHPIPRIPLLGAAALVVATVIVVAAARLAGPAAEPPTQPSAATSRELRFHDLADGMVEIHDARTGQVVEIITPGNDGFVRATMRSLARERVRLGIGAEEPFRLHAQRDGRLTLEDPATRRRVELDAFGPTNAAAFARLLTR